jgi:hypothetical protein
VKKKKIAFSICLPLPCETGSMAFEFDPLWAKLTGGRTRSLNWKPTKACKNNQTVSFTFNYRLEKFGFSFEKLMGFLSKFLPKLFIHQQKINDEAEWIRKKTGFLIRFDEKCAKSRTQNGLYHKENIGNPLGLV